MRKYIYYIITILLSIILGVYYFDAFNSIEFNINNGNIIAILLFIILGVFISYILYDLGHLLFTKIAGYHILGFRILNSHFIKKDNHFVICKSLYKDHFHPITIGSNEKNNHYNLYYLGGVIMNLIISSLIVIICLFINKNSFYSLILISFGFINTVYAFINVLPLSFLYNDGYFLYYLLKQEASKQAFHSKNALNERIYNGKNFDELNFSVYNIDNLNNDYNDPLILEFKELECYHYLYKCCYQETMNTITFIESKSNKMLSLYKNIFANLKLITLILLNNLDDATNLYLSYNTKQKRSICKCKTLDNALASYLIHTYIDKDELEAKKNEEILNKYIENTPYKGEVLPLKNLIEASKKTLE